MTPFGYEYDVVISLFIGLMPYAIYAQKEKSKIFRYETAFSQFLFEMADAMRGGIDPAKAIVELSKTDTSVLSKHLLIAAKGIDMGRPFDEMVNVMVKPIKSKLIKRYASLIAESSKVGGEISMVVHRAAKDMDDLVKDRSGEREKSDDAGHDDLHSFWRPFDHHLSSYDDLSIPRFDEPWFYVRWRKRKWPLFDLYINSFHRKNVLGHDEA